MIGMKLIRMGNIQVGGKEGQNVMEFWLIWILLPGGLGNLGWKHKKK